MTTANTLYTLLGVAPDASIETIDSAFRAREQALQGQGDEISLLRVAHDTLRNPAQRAAYDRKLAQQQQAASTPVPLEITYTAAHAPRSRALNWLVLLLAAGGTIGFFWLKKPAPAAAKPALANLSTAAPAPAAASSAPVAQEPQAAPAEEAEPTSAAAPPAARPAHKWLKPGRRRLQPRAAPSNPVSMRNIWRGPFSPSASATSPAPAS
ncbi:MAG: hypothetical protein IPO00_13255 [Betaproteobacteria bacterium]|nr:hypothetical protein [Betaproteobacteria bacterium]